MSWLAFGISFLAVFLGYAMGVFFDHRRRNAAKSGDAPGDSPKTKFTESDLEQAVEILTKVQELAGAVDGDVTRHTSRVEAISTELDQSEAADGRDSQTVLLAATKLLSANQKLQADLATAQAEIQVQRQQLVTYMSEALTDALTGISNRRSFDQELQRRFGQWQQHGLPLSLLLIDVDYFKKFNDDYGHQIGDEVLCSVAQVLSGMLGPADVLARYGGEEFAVVLPGTTLKDSRLVAQRLRQAVADHSHSESGIRGRITVSIGLAQAATHGDQFLLVKETDAALYAAKQAGRNRCFLRDGHKCRQIESVDELMCQLPSQRVERIAYFVDGKFPQEEMFQEVECINLSPTGFSFRRCEQPEFEMLLVVIGDGVRSSRITACVEESMNIGSEAAPLYQISCRFTSRIVLEEKQDSVQVGVP